ncbi:MAG: hypothetical protein JST08_14995 [Actinobacteria bacterium]|nr:hypothetical protein [Actinomycetota bacterium]
MLRRVAVLVPLALGLLVPAVAHAEASWLHDSAVAEQSTGYLPCAGTEGGVLDEVLPSVDYAEVFLDPAAPVLGGVEYVRVQWYATGGDYCRREGGTGAAIEIIPPPGTELALSSENPALCGFDTLQPASPCPAITVPGDYGGTLLADGRSGQPAFWPVSDGLNKTRLQVPIRFTRTVQSFATSPERWCNAGPCPADQTGGRVQFTVRFMPGTGGNVSAPLTTSVGVSGGPAPVPSPGPVPPAGKPKPPGKGGAKVRLIAGKVPEKLSLATLRRGWPVKVKVVAGATATARLLVGKVAVAVATKRAAKAGTVQLRLKASPRALRKLGRRAVAAKLVVSVAGKGTKPRRQAVGLSLGP